MKKIGGGNHLQNYNPENGEYSENEISYFREKDREALSNFYLWGFENPDVFFHFPYKKIHDEEYAKLFVKFARDYIDTTDVKANKIIYFLTYQQGHDKSKFLENLGYSLKNMEELKLDFMYSTDFRTLKFSRFNNFGCVECIALTKLKGHKVTSVWELKSDLSLRLITFIPGGEKLWITK